MSHPKGLVERLRDGEHIIIAEGYMWELEHRGYVSAGAFTPEVVVDHPEMVRLLSEEFAHAGSDIIEAFTYYGHRVKMSSVGREDDLVTVNMTALKIAREVADKHGKLMAGNISNTNTYVPGDEATTQAIDGIFKEQIEWAVNGKADFIIGETFTDYGEAAIALQCIQKYGNGLPAVITLQPIPDGVMYDGMPIEEGCRLLEEAGAAVVGINCSRGPDSMLPLIRKIRKSCKGPIACLPVPFRCTEEVSCFQDMRDVRTGEKAFPVNLDPWSCSREDIRKFAKEAIAIGVQYIGLCCGNRAIFIREIAEELGRTPPACKYRPNMAKHYSQVEGANMKRVAEKWNDDHSSK